LRFERFWSAYPRKVGRDAAVQSFNKRKPDDLLLDEMVRAIEKQKRSKQWQKDGGSYIPYPATWLNQGRWMDESTSDVQASGEWVQRAGFDNMWEAQNAGCFEYNAHEFHNGKRLEVHE
jgi:hypothetical protein